MGWREHWERVYSSRDTAQLSWFQQHASLSLRLIQQASIPTSASILDAGGGSSTLVDDLLVNGYEHLTVLDLSEAALAAARSRLGARAAGLRWVQADLLTADLPAHGYDVWHDRGFFHFLTHQTERRQYVHQVLQAVKPGGLVIVGTFGEDGPTRCSGLPVVRYGVSQLDAEFGGPFRLLGHERELHRTPGGSEQRFIYCSWRRLAS